MHLWMSAKGTKSPHSLKIKAFMFLFFSFLFSLIIHDPSDEAFHIFYECLSLKAITTGASHVFEMSFQVFALSSLSICFMLPMHRVELGFCMYALSSGAVRDLHSVIPGPLLTCL